MMSATIKHLFKFLNTCTFIYLQISVQKHVHGKVIYKDFFIFNPFNNDPHFRKIYFSDQNKKKEVLISSKSCFFYTNKQSVLSLFFMNSFLKNNKKQKEPLKKG